MHYLVCYDITDNRTRRQAHRILDDYGTRVQRSVFEIPDLSRDLMDQCLARLRRHLDLREDDSIRIYALCDGCLKSCTILGNGRPPMDDPDCIIV